MTDLSSATTKALFCCDTVISYASKKKLWNPLENRLEPSGGSFKGFEGVLSVKLIITLI